MGTKMERKRLFDFAIELTILIQSVYKESPGGGALHIVLDDGNVEDENILWCIENTIAELSGKEKTMYEKCAKMLLALDEKERIHFLGHHFRCERKWGVRELDGGDNQ